MNELNSWIELANNPLAVVTVVAIALVRGWIVPGPMHRERIQEFLTRIEKISESEAAWRRIAEHGLGITKQAIERGP